MKAIGESRGSPDKPGTLPTSTWRQPTTQPRPKAAQLFFANFGYCVYVLTFYTPTRRYLAWERWQSVAEGACVVERHTKHTFTPLGRMAHTHNSAANFPITAAGAVDVDIKSSSVVTSSGGVCDFMSISACGLLCIS